MGGNLLDRMKMYSEGQLTWPQIPSPGTCDQCRFFEPHKGDIGRCAQVADRYKKKGRLFVGTEAMGCSVWER